MWTRAPENGCHDCWCKNLVIITTAVIQWRDDAESQHACAFVCLPFGFIIFLMVANEKWAKSTTVQHIHIYIQFWWEFLALRFCGSNTYFMWVCVFIYFYCFSWSRFRLFVFFRCFFSYDAHIAHNLFPTFVRVIAYAEKQNLAKNIAYNVQDSRFYCYGYCILPHIYTWYVCVVVVVLVVACVCEHSRVYLSV